MPTRTASKPTSYTFNAAHAHGADMEAGWIFVPDDVSGANVTDITGNGRTLTLDGTASIVSTDATHGDCLNPGDSGASLTPPAGWDSLTDYTIIVGFQMQNDLTSGESFWALAIDPGSQDSCVASWNAGEDSQIVWEDADTSNLATTITDAFNTNSGEWGTIAGVCEGGVRVDNHSIIDGEATQNANNTTGDIGGSTSNNFFTLGSNLGGTPGTMYIEYCYIFSSNKSQAEIESLHVDPYQMLDAVGGLMSAQGVILNP